MAYTPDFEIAHIGVNCADAAQAERCAEQFAVLFRLAVNPAKESADARFTGTQIEWMKAPGAASTDTSPLPPPIFPRPAAIWRKKALPLTRTPSSGFPTDGSWSSTPSSRSAALPSI